MASLYESDFYAWTKEQVCLFKDKALENLDIPNLIEEIESLGRQEQRELRNRLSVLLGHLLKWQYQPANRGNSWLATVREQRREVILLLKQSPSLKPYLAEALELGYEAGLDLAVRETGLDYSAFPTECPYTLEQALDDTFFPI